MGVSQNERLIYIGGDVGTNFTKIIGKENIQSFIIRAGLSADFSLEYRHKSNYFLETMIGFSQSLYSAGYKDQILYYSYHTDGFLTTMETDFKQNILRSKLVFGRWLGEKLRIAPVIGLYYNQFLTQSAIIRKQNSVYLGQNQDLTYDNSNVYSYNYSLASEFDNKAKFDYGPLVGLFFSLSNSDKKELLFNLLYEHGLKDQKVTSTTQVISPFSEKLNYSAISVCIGLKFKL